MISLELAGVRIRIDNQYPFLEQQCRNYLCDFPSPDLSIRVTPEEIAKEQTFGVPDPGYCESVCAYRRIAGTLPDFGIFLLHAAVVQADGKAYAFAAPSGTGKSTHIALWKKFIPNVRIISGDKPLVRLESDGSFTVFGTPWNGREGWGEPISATLCGICFLEQSKENKIRPATEQETVLHLMRQLYMEGEKESVDRRLSMMDLLVRTVPAYLLSCNVSKEAALLSYRTLTTIGGKTK